MNVLLSWQIHLEESVDVIYDHRQRIDILRATLVSFKFKIGITNSSVNLLYMRNATKVIGKLEQYVVHSFLNLITYTHLNKHLLIIIRNIDGSVYLSV